MALATGAFVGSILLGNWQLQRLDWKLRLIHDVSTRIHAVPVAAPGPTAWPHIEKGQLQYLHVRLTGHFLAGKQTLVHGTSTKGYGYWIMVPFKTDQGVIVLVNRGYIPSSLVDTPGYKKTHAPKGDVVVTGLLRFTETGGGFLRRNRPDDNLWYSRDVAAILTADNLQVEQAAPYFVDAIAVTTGGIDISAAANPEGWPLAGLTKTHFQNPHLGYAITWYLMALACVLAAGIMIYQERRLQNSPG